MNKDNSIHLHLRSDSQDAWIFQSPLSSSVIEESSFNLGVARCDNRLGYIFSSNGYKVYNPALKIHAIELQSLRSDQSIYDIKGSVQGPTRYILISSMETVTSYEI